MTPAINGRRSHRDQRHTASFNGLPGGAAALRRRGQYGYIHISSLAGKRTLSRVGGAPHPPTAPSKSRVNAFQRSTDLQDRGKCAYDKHSRQLTPREAMGGPRPASPAATKPRARTGRAGPTTSRTRRHLLSSESAKPGAPKSRFARRGQPEVNLSLGKHQRGRGLERHETMMGQARAGRLAVEMESPHGLAALVGQNGVYCRTRAGSRTAKDGSRARPRAVPRCQGVGAERRLEEFKENLELKVRSLLLAAVLSRELSAGY